MSMAINFVEDHCHKHAIEHYKQKLQGMISDIFCNITNVYVAYCIEIWILCKAWILDRMKLYACSVIGGSYDRRGMKPIVDVHYISFFLLWTCFW
jgi:hypothetical protein